MLYELRIYNCLPGRLPALLKRFETATLGIWEKHGIRPAGFWTVQASIFADNAASIEFHQRCGFRVVGTRERIGQLDGVWRDTVLLERRSP